MIVVEFLNALLEFGALLTLLERHAKQAKIRVERELIHRIDFAQIVEDKEQNGSALSTRSIALF